MSKIRLIPYKPSDLSALLNGFVAERGFLGAFPSLVPDGYIYGIVDAPPTTPVHPEYGYPGPAGTKDNLISKIIDRLFAYRSDTSLVVQDPWALEDDYKSRLPSDNDVHVVDGAVYIRINRASPQSSVREVIRTIVSYSAVLIFEDDYDHAFSTCSLIQHAFAVAIEAFDGQGWLVWVRKGAVKALSGIQH